MVKVTFAFASSTRPFIECPQPEKRFGGSLWAVVISESLAYGTQNVSLSSAATAAHANGVQVVSMVLSFKKDPTNKEARPFREGQFNDWLEANRKSIQDAIDRGIHTFVIPAHLANGQLHWLCGTLKLDDTLCRRIITDIFGQLGHDVEFVNADADTGAQATVSQARGSGRGSGRGRPACQGNCDTNVADPCRRCHARVDTSATADAAAGLRPDSGHKSQDASSAAPVMDPALQKSEDRQQDFRSTPWSNARERDAARREADKARREADEARREADEARRQADEARRQAAAAEDRGNSALFEARSLKEAADAAGKKAEDDRKAAEVAAKMVADQLAALKPSGPVAAQPAVGVPLPATFPADIHTGKGCEPRPCGNCRSRYCYMHGCSNPDCDSCLR